MVENGADSFVTHVEQLCDQLSNCLLGMKPTLRPGTPGDNLTDAAGAPPTPCTETQTFHLKTNKIAAYVRRIVLNTQNRNGHQVPFRKSGF